MSNVLLVASGLGLLIIQTSVLLLAPIHISSPNLILPISIYLGVSPNVQLVRGAAVSFCLGYFLDLFSGGTLGLQTLVTVSTYLIARGAGLRFVLRGPIFQIALTFIVGVIAGLATLALMAIFEPPLPPIHIPLSRTIKLIWLPSLISAVAAPGIFWLLRRVDMSRRVKSDA